jgi:CubicO group peptidase (beta-lactamase class C family)
MDEKGVADTAVTSHTHDENDKGAEEVSIQIENLNVTRESEIYIDDEYVNEDIITPKKTRPGPFESAGGTVYGMVAEGWESVREAFADNFALNLERGAQLTIYQHSKLVVDLHGNANTTSSESIFNNILNRSKPKDVYNGQTIQNMYSSGKNMEVICIALLADRGLMSYSDLVIKHWPEFGQFGKGDITVADVLRHEAGIPFFTDPLVMQKRTKDRQLTKQDVDNVEVLDRLIEASGKCYLYGRRHYHACTRGWIVSGIIRRVDAQHRSLGQFMREEICQPLHLDLYCGIPRDQQKLLNIANIVPLSSKNVTLQMAPAVVGQSSDKTLKGILNTFKSLDHPLLRHSE